MGEGQGKGSVKNQTKNQNEYPSALKYLISLQVPSPLILPVTL
jgi:hypothetical protein